MNAATSGAGHRIIRPSWRGRLPPLLLCVVLVVLGGFAAGPLFRLPPQGLTIVVMLIFSVVGFELLYFLVFLATVRAELGPTEIVRRSIFGRKALPIANIVAAARRGRALIVSTVKTKLAFGVPFSAAQLQAIEDHIREAASAIAGQA